MSEALADRRYLVPFKASRLPQQFTDVLIIGGGVAGLRAAIAASETAEVLLLTKDTIDQSNTWYAQGGIAAVLQPADSIESHINDTKIGGAGLCDDRAVHDVAFEEAVSGECCSRGLCERRRACDGPPKALYHPAPRRTAWPRDVRSLF